MAQSSLSIGLVLVLVIRKCLINFPAKSFSAPHSYQLSGLHNYNVIFMGLPATDHPDRHLSMMNVLNIFSRLAPSIVSIPIFSCGLA